METKIQPSRQLNFSDETLSEPVDRNEDGECGMTAEDNGDLKPLDMSTSSADREMKDQISCHTKNNLYGRNVHLDHNHDSNKFHNDKKILGFSESLATVDVTDSLETEATNGRDFDKNKTFGEFHVVLDSSNHSNLEPMKNVETEEFEMSSDDDLFGDPLIFEELCRSSAALCHGTQDQENDDSQGCVNLEDNNKQDFSQSVDSISVKIERSNDVDETQCALPLKETKTHLDVKKEIQSKASMMGQKQQSLLSFVTTENKKATTSKASLKQTDIGVFFGLRPLKKPEDSNTATQNDAEIAKSSQAASVSQRHGGWTGRNKYNRDFKNAGYTSDGQSSGHAEDVAAVGTGTQSRRSCPFYKKIPNCGITVDAFRYGDIPGCRAYFLSHFHYDHYAGLNGKFTNPIYCSKVN